MEFSFKSFVLFSFNIYVHYIMYCIDSNVCFNTLVIDLDGGQRRSTVG